MIFRGVRAKFVKMLAVLNRSNRLHWTLLSQLRHTRYASRHKNTINVGLPFHCHMYRRSLDFGEKWSCLVPFPGTVVPSQIAETELPCLFVGSPGRAVNQAKQEIKQ